MNLDDDHEVLFLHGGASTQFMQVPMNLLMTMKLQLMLTPGYGAPKHSKKPNFLVMWMLFAVQKKPTIILFLKDFAVPNNAKYFHLTTNNTIYGTQWQSIPHVSMPLVADMCSDIFSRQRDFNSFGFIYAGAQKNMGPAGVNLVIVNKNILGKVEACFTNHYGLSQSYKRRKHAQYTSCICSICFFAYASMA